jgi:hypothetical protein
MGRMDTDRSSPLDAARATALARWQAENGASALGDRALHEAAVLATVGERDDQAAFNEDFHDLAVFIADMPF